MEKNRGIYKGSGLSLLLGGIFFLLSYLLFALGIGRLGLPQVFRVTYIIDLHKNIFVKLGINILPLAFILFLLGATGALVWFWDRSRGLGLAGYTLGVLGILLILDITLIEIGFVRVVSGVETTLAPMANKIANYLIALDKFLLTPSVFLIELLFFLWGLALIESSKRSRLTGIIFLLEVLSFLAAASFYVFKMRFAAGVGLFVTTLIMVLGLIYLGALLMGTNENLRVEGE